jgi:hypothetical protein
VEVAKGQATALADFGDPVHADGYSLCLDLAHPCMFFAGEIQRMVNGGTPVTAW